MQKSIEILFEDENCLVINKPAGLAVQGGAGIKISLDSILTENYPLRPLLVHRLDRDTSGVILVAKNQAAAAHYSALLGPNAYSIKEYLAVCAGRPKKDSGLIDTDIEINGKMKKCETRYTVLKTSEFPAEVAESACCKSYSGVFSLVKLELGTGRMHQIRRHMAQACTPVLCDDKYGDFKLNKLLAKTLKLKHLLLHAQRLQIPAGQGAIPSIDVCAPLPKYFSEFLEIK